MKQPTAVAKGFALGFSACLMSGLVAYQAGAFDRFFVRPQPTGTQEVSTSPQPFSSSKYVLLPSIEWESEPAEQPPNNDRETWFSGSKSAPMTPRGDSSGTIVLPDLEGIEAPPQFSPPAMNALQPPPRAWYEDNPAWQQPAANDTVQRQTVVE